MTTHAQLSPSGASRWLVCPGSVALTQGMPDSSSDFADEGTAAHELASDCLTDGSNAIDHKGRRIAVGFKTFEVDLEMAENVQKYIDIVRALPGELMVEQRLSITPITGEPDAFGTSDAVIMSDGELIIVDLKYGRGVRVDAEDNEQLAIYALAALLEYDLLGPFERVRMMIVQPRLNHVSEWSVPVAEIMGFARNIEKPCARAMQFVRKEAEPVASDFNPSEDACRWCKAKATCPALAAKVQDVVGADFEDIATGAILDHCPPIGALTDPLATKMQAVDLIEDWCKAVRAEVERRLFAGVDVPGYKLVEGRRGSRAWGDAEAAEQMLKTFRIKHDEMYEYKLISPTTAEKLAKSKVIGERQWPKLTALITQSEGKPSVAPASDKRPALVVKPTADEFQDETVEDLV